MKKIFAVMLALAMVLSMTACGAKEEAAPVTLDVGALYESYSQYLPEMFYPDENTMLDFLGIPVELCTQYQVAICAEGMRTDEIWLIEARDEAALAELKELAETRIAAKKDETVSYAPDQYVVVEKAQLLTKDLYLALLISPEVDALKAGFEKACQ